MPLYPVKNLKTGEVLPIMTSGEKIIRTGIKIGVKGALLPRKSEIGKIN
jgi:hypothetical protein